jgi:hypothetical protein
VAPTDAPNKPLEQQSHEELDKTAQAAGVEFSSKDLRKVDKVRELVDAHVPDPGATAPPAPSDTTTTPTAVDTTVPPVDDTVDDEPDVDGEGDQPVGDATAAVADASTPPGADTAQEGQEPANTTPGPNAPETDQGENQNPPTGEMTPPDTLATTSITDPEAVGSPGAVSGGLDEDQAREEVLQRVEGRTSDASMRTADDRAAEVPADSPLAGPKPSDAGPEDYPFPTAGDVDVATVPTDTHDGERRQPIPVGTFVLLADHEDVPKRLIGHVAMVTNSPTVLCNCDFAPRTHEHQSENQPLTVRMRDETNATLMLYPDAFQQVGVAGRHEVLPIG